MQALIAILDQAVRNVFGWASANFWEAVLVVMFFMMARLLYQAHTATGNNFDIKYLLIDERTEHVSLKKMGALLALITSTWIVLYLTVKGSVTESILGLYLFVWAGVYVTPQTVAAWRNPPQQPQGANNGQAG